ncbi:MAG TPA: alpha-amylase family glycosyl hydrolase, partial [Gaiellaceae bacterium]|nr:alpha-amylase family glycosyl hydrolase [Gaiellaceae bacterium]
MSEWWRNAVIYEIYVRSFADGDGDGVGDLAGIRTRLPYLRELGVDALWLTPFFPSPGADHGYDVSSYVDVDPQFGTLADFDALLEDAHALGLRVVIDVVPNHTSIEHPWFREHPEYYVWADEPNNWLSVFGGPAWERDEQTGRWYLHLFAPEQPDLDWHHPDVRREFESIFRFWLDRGVDGIR